MIIAFVFSLIFFYSQETIIILKLSEREKIETVWTLIPALILILLGIPSAALLYQTECHLHPSLTVKATGHQWFWSYDYTGIEGASFDSFMKQTKRNKRDFLYLDVDNNLVLPINTNILLILTSSDVIHRWAVPALNLKLDANPGRLSTLIFNTTIPGLYYGQCSELCGANHSFIPICVEITSPMLFKTWLKTITNSLPSSLNIRLLSERKRSM